MNSNDWKEKRDSVRADISTTVKIKLVDRDGHKLSSFKKSACQKSDGAASQKRLSTGTLPPKRSFTIPDFPSSLEETTNPMISYLIDSVVLLNEKLDKVIDLLEDNKDDNYIAVKETVNISGSGMKLILYDPVQKGQLLDISLHIPGFPITGFNACGEVVHTKTIQKKDMPLYEIGLKFINLLEEERDLLIAYAFSQERRKSEKINIHDSLKRHSK